jgi:hypothetical protein
MLENSITRDGRGRSRPLSVVSCPTIGENDMIGTDPNWARAWLSMTQPNNNGPLTTDH